MTTMFLLYVILFPLGEKPKEYPADKLTESRKECMDAAKMIPILIQKRNPNTGVFVACVPLKVRQS